MEDTSHHQLIQSEDELAHILKSAVELEVSFAMNARFESYISHVIDGKSPKVVGDLPVSGGQNPNAFAHLLEGLNRQGAQVLERMQDKDNIFAGEHKPEKD